MRKFKSIKGLVFCLCIALASFIFLLNQYRLDPAVKAAILEARMAEMALRDPNGDLTFNRAQKNGSLQRTTRWLSWPTLRAVPKPEKRSLLRFPADGSHLLHDNGLLLTNPSSNQHPILSLLRQAEQKWEALQSKQSKTLKQATAEYRKRYRRVPPPGFDSWWKNVRENRVLLPDEYNQIEKDLAPFRALEPSELRHRNRVMQDRPHTFTVVIQNGQVSLEGQFAYLERATDIASVISMFSKDLPHDLNMTFVMDDQPAVMVQHEQKARMLEMAEDGAYFGPSDYVEEESDSELSNYARVCSPSSPLRRQEMGELPSAHTVETLSTRSFISDPIKANDLCLHPEIKSLHGHTVTNGTDLTPMVPLFTWAKMPTHSDILVTPLEQYSDEYIGYDPAWTEKSENRLLWRGSTTGADFTKNSPWQLSQRARLHFMTKEQNGTHDIMFTERDGSVRTAAYSAGLLNEHYMDTSFSGMPAQCDPETCEFMEKNIDFAETQGLDASYQYKYVMDVDGNAWSGRFHRLMSTRSLVLKSTVFPEWYADRLIPWYHYIPVKIDYSDLYDIMAFFVGTPDGKGSHDQIAQRIAENGRLWAKRYWRRVDMASYMHRLVLEYSRLLYPEESTRHF